MKSRFVLTCVCFVLVALFRVNAQENGQKPYEEQCSKCHKKNGKGMMRIYPPLLESEWLQNDSTLIRLTLTGLNGEIIVGDRIYNKEMPSFSHLSNEQLAAILSYIRQEFGTNKSPISAEKVLNARTLLK